MTSPQSNDQSAPILNKFALTARDNWTWAAPLVYLYVTIVGMVQSWFHFNAFQINVFDFAEINDFLLAAFREPTSFIFILLMVVYAIFITFLTIWLSSRKVVIGEQAFRNIRFFNYFVALCILFLAPVAGPTLKDWYKPNWKFDYVKNSSLKFEALFRMSNNSFSTDQKFVSDLTLIGTTEKYIFFVKQTSGESDSYKVYISPVSNVIQIRGDIELPVSDQKTKILQLSSSS